MLVSADSVTAPHCAAGTISFLTDSTGLLAVIFSDTLVLAMRLGIAVLVFVHAGGCWCGVGRIVLRGPVGGSCVSWAGVGLASLSQSGEAAVLEETAL